MLSLPQVKELGVVVYNCSCLAEDLGKIFEAYWFLGQSGQEIPATWPSNFSTAYNKDTPLQLPLNDTQSGVYLSVSFFHYLSLSNYYYEVIWVCFLPHGHVYFLFVI